MKIIFGPNSGLKPAKPGQNYNNFHNILSLFDVLQNFPFTASEAMRDYNMVYTSTLTSCQTT